MQISIGRMEYDSEKMRGVMDRSFASIKLAFHKDSSAIDVLNKCRECVWGEEHKNYQYFLADGSGTAIDSCSFDIDHLDGKKESLPWTLSNYIRVSNAKYPSRVRLYCVRKLCSGKHFWCQYQCLQYVTTTFILLHIVCRKGVLTKKAM